MTSSGDLVEPDRPARPVIEAVLFDAGGVLVVPDPTVLAPLLAPYGASADLAVHVRAHYFGMAAKSRTGGLEWDWAVYDEAFVECVGVAAADRDEAAMVLNRTRHAHLWRWPVGDGLEGLAALERGGVPVGVVSNASGQVESTLRRIGACQVGEGVGTAVRCIVDSHVVGVAKPDPAIFEHAAPALGAVERGNVAYVGDSITIDVGAARAAGMHPVLYDPFDDHVGDDADGSFERVTSIAAWVRTSVLRDPAA